jgi:hypothetical protein
MKSSYFLPLSVVAFAIACTDATAPDPRSALTPKNPTLLVAGHIPPPPADAAITITVNSTPVTGNFTGVYFANGASVESVAAANEVGDAPLAFNGTAWLRLDNTQTFGPTASANARFQVIQGVTDPIFSGRGTLVIMGETIRIVDVTSFTANPDCPALSLLRCAHIEFTATIDSDPGVTHFGHVDVFDRASCISMDEVGNLIFNCPEIGS